MTVVTIVTVVTVVTVGFLKKFRSYDCCFVLLNHGSRLSKPPAVVVLSERGILGGGPWFAGQPARCRLCSTHVVLTIGVCVLTF